MRKDEGDSEVTAALRPSVRYLLGAARSATYTVRDDESDDPARGRVLRPRVEAIADPRTPEHVQDALRAQGDAPWRVLRFAWDAPSDVALAHVFGWEVEWAEVADCDEAAPAHETRWPGRGFWTVAELERIRGATEVLHRPAQAAHFRVRAKLVGAGAGPWTAPVCGDLTKLETAQGGASAPVVTGARIVSAPGTGGAFRAGEVVEAEVRFSEAVTVDASSGTPTLAVVLGSARREAAYAGGSGTQALVFRHAVGPEDAGARTARVVAGGLALNGATIRGTSGIDAALGFALAPVVTRVAVEADADGDGVWSPGEAVTVTVAFSDAVTVRTDTGTPSVAVVLAGGARGEAAYAGGSGTAVLTFAYAVQAEDGAVRSVFVPENALRRNGGAIAGPTGLAAVLAHGGAGLAGTPRTPPPAQPALSVADAAAVEGATLAFAVTLAPAAAVTVRVDWTTRDDTARAGEDYEAGSGTLVFSPGETAKTIRITVLDDAHDEYREVMLVVLSDPVGATLAKAAAGGTIENADPMPQAWLARFGRTVAEQVLDAVEGRMRGAPAAGVEVTVAGRRLGGGAPDAEALEEAQEQARIERLSAWLAGETQARERGTRTVTPRALLTGSSFALTAGSDEPGGARVSLWGRGAVTRFDGREDAVALDGEVGGVQLGADWTGARSTLGLMLSHARGEGGYRSRASTAAERQGEASSGAVASTLTGLYPYGRYALTERVTVWGAAGVGEGTLTLTPDGRRPFETDLDLAMAAAGLRGVVVEAPAQGGPELAVKTDALGVWTSSDAVTGSAAAGGNLAAAQGDVTRLRLGLEGTWRGLGLGSGVLAPRLEVGVRHDGGDAETGFGLDLGGGLAWSDPATGLRAEASGRGLLTHESAGLDERGFAGALGWDPRPGTDRGPSLTVRQTLGRAASGGAQALLGRTTLAGLAANDDGDELQRRRLEVTFGYGFGAFGGRFTARPEAGLAVSQDNREYSLTWRLVRDRRGGDIGSLELALEARRRESANDDTPPEDTVGLRATARW